MTDTEITSKRGKTADDRDAAAAARARQIPRRPPGAACESFRS